MKTVVIGAGLVGSLLSLFLKRRGLDLVAYERRPDPRRTAGAEGRSINLVVTSRGIAALEAVGLWSKVQELCVPVRGRMIHPPSGPSSYHAYGRDDSECNYSVSRGELNQFLISQAEAAGISFHFSQVLEKVDWHASNLLFADRFSDEHSVEQGPVPFDRVFFTDGAGSVGRTALHVEFDRKGVRYAEDVMPLGTSYKELVLPCGPDGKSQLDRHALHIWPRGSHMLMALANRDGSFTLTLYLPDTGEVSFAALKTPQQVQHFFTEHYAGLLPLVPNLEEQYFAHPVGRLATVRCAPWCLDDRALLLGDAAHAIVPFFGQGMNCGFEDCLELDQLIAHHGFEKAGLFDQFFKARKPNADAIADMALENFVEMSARTADPQFLLRKQVERRLEREFPALFRTRYALVAYSLVPYQTAAEAGKIQDEILARLTRGLTRPEDLDMKQAHELLIREWVPWWEEKI